MRTHDDAAEPASGAPGAHERGSATAEFALALPAVVLVLLLAISLAMQGAARVSLEDAARAAARELARGETTAVAEQTVRDTAGAQVNIAFSQGGAYSRVVLTQPVTILGLIELNAEQSAEAQARTEHLAGMGGSP